MIIKALKPLTPIQNFVRMFSVGDGCWEWRGRLDDDGYGVLTSQKTKTSAHRFSWKQWNGEIPVGFCVLHKCDNRKCVRPDHLFLGTNRDNQLDKVGKGRQAKGSNHGQSKLTEEVVREIRKIPESEINFSEQGRKFGVSYVAVRQAYRRRFWQHVK